MKWKGIACGAASVLISATGMCYIADELSEPCWKPLGLAHSHSPMFKCSLSDFPCAGILISFLKEVQEVEREQNGSPNTALALFSYLLSMHEHIHICQRIHYSLIQVGQWFS